MRLSGEKMMSSGRYDLQVDAEPIPVPAGHARWVAKVVSVRSHGSATERIGELAGKVREHYAEDPDEAIAAALQEADTVLWSETYEVP